jgi:hypothetical protein
MRTFFIVAMLGVVVSLTGCIPFFVSDHHEYRHDRYDRHPVRVDVVPVVEVH